MTTKEEFIEMLPSVVYEGKIEFAPQPQNIVFHIGGKAVLTITKDGITADPSVPVDDAAKAIFEALEPYLRSLR